MPLLFTTKFSSARQFKNRIELFLTFFYMKSVKVKCKIEFFLFCFFFSISPLVYGKFQGEVLSNRVYSSDRHYGQIVSICR